MPTDGSREPLKQGCYAYEISDFGLDTDIAMIIITDTDTKLLRLTR